ncbi:MAG: nicotinate-nucleotide--dimethylbenzimidazole phosphoribosyltransferase [Devosiaceae bacterium]|nr:nicotinate-nucleotide--dimethylbenzimidazole phosphoribosyltransferase [Devosiaceae bacterium]
MPSTFTDFTKLLKEMPSGSQDAVDSVRQHDAQLTKPLGSLGKMDDLVEFLARWQEKEKPTLNNPMIAIFAGNHGVAAQNVSAFPASVTVQMVANFTNGGAAISQIARQHELNLRVFELALEIPTGDISVEAALDDKTCAATIAYGMEAIAGEPDLLCIGEMGIANTTIAAAIFAALFGGTGSDWVGAGTGMDEAGIAHKAEIVDRALALHKDNLNDPFAVLSRLGGREFAAMLGAIISARHHKIPVIIDGFVATAAAAIAHKVNPASLEHCMFAHVSGEHAHQRALTAMNKSALLDLGLRLGEGSGAALAAVLVKTALYTHQNMATFEQAAVSGKNA